MTMTTLLRLPLGTHRWRQLLPGCVLHFPMFLRAPTAAAPFVHAFGCVCIEFCYAAVVRVCAVQCHRHSWQ